MTKLTIGTTTFTLFLTVAVVVFLRLCEYVLVYFGVTEFWISLFDVLVVAGAITFTFGKLNPNLFK
jgi:hypothetical protein|tara:strand:+ start:517 stop:714 length:198 start_codon:yes stop_codon:yes gene_type:complete